MIQYPLSGRTTQIEPEWHSAGRSRTADGAVHEALYVVRHKLWLILAFMVAAIGVGAWFAHRELPRYSATASLQVANLQRSIAGSIAPTNPDAGLPWGVDQILTYIEVLKSRAVAAEAVDTAGLRLHNLTPGLPARLLTGIHFASQHSADTVLLRFDRESYEATSGAGRSAARYGEPVTVGDLQLTVQDRPPVDEARLAVLSREDAINWLRATISARPRPSTAILDVTAVALDPHLAERAANGTAQAFHAVTGRQVRQDARTRRVFLETQLAINDSMLNVAEASLTEHRRQERAYDARSKFQGEQEVLQRLRTDEDAFRRELTVHKSLLATLNTPTPGPDSKFALVGVTGGVVSELYLDWLHARRSLDSLRSGPFARKESHPDVARLNGKLESAKRDLTAALSGQIDLLEARLGQLDAAKREATGQIASIPEAEARETRLLRDVEGYRRGSERLRDELQVARVAEAVEAGPIEVLDLATPVPAPLGKGGARKMLFTAIIGLAIGFGAALTLHRLNTSVRRPEDVREILTAPGLAVIPRLGADNWRRMLRLPRSSQANNRATLELVSLDPSSLGAEAYRRLMTGLAFSEEAGPLRVLGVVSPSLGEGKSTTAANLAVTYALQGMRVLLIDADLRRGRIHESFRLHREPGLADALTSGEFDTAYLTPTAVPGLHVLTRGRAVVNPLELLSSTRMRSLLLDMRDRYDIVIVDTSAALPTAEAPLLAARADGVLIVLRAGYTERAAVEATLRQLDRMGARVIGTVLNDPDGQLLSQTPYYVDYYEPDPEPQTAGR